MTSSPFFFPLVIFFPPRRRKWGKEKYVSAAEVGNGNFLLLGSFSYPLVDFLAPRRRKWGEEKYDSAAEGKKLDFSSFFGHFLTLRPIFLPFWPFSYLRGEENNFLMVSVSSVIPITDDRLGDTPPC